MCGRFTLTQDRKTILDELDVVEWDVAAADRPRYNVAPTQDSAVLVQRPGAPGSRRALRTMRWGLVPSWAKDTTNASKLINARGESLAEKPSFRNLVGRRRCVVVTDGFFEWKKDGVGSSGKPSSVPYYVHAPGGALLPMAGLWDVWRGPDEAVLTTFTIVTGPARSDLQWLHDRMPAILSRTDLDAWLDVESTGKDAALALLEPYEGALESFPVSKLVSSPRYDSPEIVRRVDPAPIVQPSLF